MSTPLERAEQAVAEARRAVWKHRDDANLDRLVAAVRAHDTEIVRAIEPEAMVSRYARDTIANRLDPDRGQP